jgi:hypothetical protein
MHRWETVQSHDTYDLTGVGFYWKAMFDTQDELYKLIARFNQFAVQEIASTVSQISLLLERYHHETSTAIADVSQKVDLIHQDTKETNERVRRYSDLLDKIAAGKAPNINSRLSIQEKHAPRSKTFTPKSKL